MNSLNYQKTRNLIAIFAGLIVLASAALTFSFFFEHLPSLVPQSIFGALIAGLIAGLLGVLIYEAGALIWLRAYLHGSENNDQRTIAIWMSGADIIGGAVASFAQIIFAGTDLVNISESGRFYVGIAALLAIAFGIVFNFVAIWLFQQNSEESKTAIREANRRAIVQEKEQEQENLLDKLIGQKVAQKLELRAEALAEEKAEKIVLNRVRLERDGDTEPIPQKRAVSAATALPATTAAVAADSPPERLELRESGTGKA